MKTKKRIKIGIATTFVIVILMSLCGSRFVFQKACVRRETSWLNMGTADDYIYNLLVDAYDKINLIEKTWRKNNEYNITYHGSWYRQPIWNGN